MGISYRSDPHKAIRLALEAARDVPRVLPEPAPNCLLVAFGDSTVDLELRFWIRDPVNGIANVRSEVMLNMWDLYQQHGIELPHPQRDLTLRNPEALAGVLSDTGRPSVRASPSRPSRGRQREHADAFQPRRPEELIDRRRDLQAVARLAQRPCVA